MQATETVTAGGFRALDTVSFRAALRTLTESDTRLAAIVDAYGPPPFWTREPGFPTLLHIILEQQVSLASALAAFRRVSEMTNPLTPESFLTLTDDDLLACGFSRQKARYGRALAQTILDKKLALNDLEKLPDDEVRDVLTRVTGIGPWTADIYLLIALRRPDCWPVGDLALVKAVQECLELPSRVSAEEMESLSQPWRPWRAVATRLFWHYYLSTDRTRSPRRV